MLNELEKGFTDVIVTPHKRDIKGIEYVPVFTENIILIGSANINKSELISIIDTNDINNLEKHLLQYKWYRASSDNEHFVRFWQSNFHKNPDFRQNFIVPNFISIVRSLGYGCGVAIVPDFLCADAIEKGSVQILWKGYNEISNELYFAYRKNSIYKNQIETLLKAFI